MTGIGAASARGEAKDENATLVPPIPEKLQGNVKRTINGLKSKYLKINHCSKTQQNTKNMHKCRIPMGSKDNQTLYLVNSFV